MNFIAGNFVYHAEEYIAFWLFVSVVEEFEMRDLYMPSNRNLNKIIKIFSWFFVK